MHVYGRLQRLEADLSEGAFDGHRGAEAGYVVLEDVDVEETVWA